MTPAPRREDLLARLRDRQPWDVLIVGGGASGLGAAVDAAARGYRTLLVEARDFAAGTSSCSTKLIHGGVRYLRQGNLRLVRQALHERSRLLANAPHLVQPLAFVIPARSTGERLFYGAGLKLYDLLAGSQALAASTAIDRDQLFAALPGLRDHKFSGGIRYWDGQFDDARLAIALMRTAGDRGATCVNYLPLTGLLKSAGRITGALLRDAESGEEFAVDARVVINATGVHADLLRRLDEPAVAPLLTPSQGIHLVVDADFLPGNEALLIPKTEDGRVMFAIPWQGKLLIGTTDTPRPELGRLDDPQPLAAEIDYVLRTAAGVLARPPGRADIRSIFAGLRPLLHPDHAADRRTTAALSREHAVLVSPAGLVTIAGGKWTTYRLMAEEVVDRAAAVAGLPAVACPTQTLPLHGQAPPAAGPYGSDAAQLATLPGVDRQLHPALALSEAQVRFAVRFEAARSVEDVLARRSRALFLDAKAAAECSDAVGALLADELALSAARRDQLVAAARRRAGEFLAPA